MIRLPRSERLPLLAGPSNLLLVVGMAVAVAVVAFSYRAGRPSLSAPRVEAPRVHSATEPATEPVHVSGLAGVAKVGAVTVAFSAPSHSPAVDRPWRVVLTSTRSGRPIPARVRLDVLFAGETVGHLATGRFSHGSYRRVVRWPERAAGRSLAVKATVDVAGGRPSFVFPLRVRGGTR